MFKEIYVKDFVLIEELHLSFDQGFSAFTGETGAGKSLLIDAISLLCGQRASSSLIKQGKEKAIVEGVFELKKNHPVFKQCDAYGIDYEEEMITVSRTLTNDGKSLARINQRVVSLSILKEVMSEIIDIHSQHDSQYLLNNKYHLTLLDKFIQEDTLQKQVAQAFREYDAVHKEYEDLLQNEYNVDDLDYLQFQIQEIEAAHLSVLQEEEALAEQKKMNSFEKINHSLQQALNYLNGSEAVLELLHLAQKELSTCNEFDEISTIHSDLMDCYYTLDEKCSEIQNQLDHLEYDEQRYNEIQEYLFQLGKLKRKYGHSVELILEKKEELIQQVQKIENRQEVLSSLEKQMNQKYASFESLAHQLSQRRQEKAKLLEQFIQKECQDLYLPHAVFSVVFKPSKPTWKGLDEVEFHISMNPGEPCRPLESVASGGELSRLMLGLKTIFTSLTAIETVIFDEIDTGVSGRVALAIGKKMRKIAENQQVFAITHLSPVAACSQKHFIVEKHQKQHSTETQIRLLNNQERIETMALMSTSSSSPSAISSALELFEIAQKTNQ